MAARSDEGWKGGATTNPGLGAKGVARAGEKQPPPCLISRRLVCSDLRLVRWSGPLVPMLAAVNQPIAQFTTVDIQRLT